MKRAHLFEWGVFFIVVIGMLAWKGLLFDMSPFLWGVLALVIVVVGVVDFLVDGVTRPLFAMLGLGSGGGPLVVSAREEGDDLVLTLINKGRGPVNVWTVIGFDHRQQEVFVATLTELGASDRPDQAVIRDSSKHKVAGKSGSDVRLVLSELKKRHCKSLKLVDSSGGEWPVTL